MDDIGLSLDGIKEFLDGQIARFRQSLTDNFYPTYDKYTAAWGKYAAAKDIREEWNRLAEQLSHEE